MTNSMSIDLPDFIEQQPLGEEGIVDRIGGEYRRRPAVAIRLIESAAHIGSVTERFLRYASDLEALSNDLRRTPPAAPHARIPEVLFQGRDNRGEAVLIMALPQGGCILPLQDAGHWSEIRALHLCAQLAETLRVANQRGLYSCSLSPSSLFVTGTAQAGARPIRAEVTILNLGLSGVEAALYQATGQHTIGLADEDLVYRAPELRQDPCQITEQAEVFSLAALLHFLILGRLRGGTNGFKIGVREEVRNLILGMLNQHAHERPALRQVNQRILTAIAELNDFELIETVWEQSDCSLHAALQVSAQRVGWLRMLSPRVSAGQRAQILAVAESLQQAAQPGVIAPLEAGEQPDQSPYIFSAKVGASGSKPKRHSDGPNTGAPASTTRWRTCAATCWRAPAASTRYTCPPEKSVYQSAPSRPVSAHATGCTVVGTIASDASRSSIVSTPWTRSSNARSTERRPAPRSIGRRRKRAWQP